MKVAPGMEIKLLKDYKFVGKTRTKPFREVLKAGEIGVYCSISHCFVFSERRRWRPYIFVFDLDKHPDLFVVVNEGGDE